MFLGMILQTISIALDTRINSSSIVIFSDQGAVDRPPKSIIFAPFLIISETASLISTGSIKTEPL